MIPDEMNEAGPAGREDVDAGRCEKSGPEYRTPELRELGGLELVQGRNYYRDKDAGNDNYYI